mmetsp:Transcript_27535/g.27209  ORF Transcript_27535/g.27209 Transcript_27535/m.27209 type:complete len:204 (+) Transcript_27535:81-692(+)
MDIEDVSILREIPNVEVLSLSVNKISTLKYFQCCSKLTELYLRKNSVSDLRELKYLKNLSGLKVLWLWDNPCAENERYREIVLSYLPNLIKLDNQNVSQEEKSQINPAEVQKTREEIENHPKASEKPKMQRDEIIKDERKEADMRREPSPFREPLKPKTRNEAKQVEKPGDNILCAVLSLLKELDENGLEIVKREIDKRVGNR